MRRFNRVVRCGISIVDVIKGARGCAMSLCSLWFGLLSVCAREPRQTKVAGVA